MESKTNWLREQTCDDPKVVLPVLRLLRPSLLTALDPLGCEGVQESKVFWYLQTTRDISSVLSSIIILKQNSFSVFLLSFLASKFIKGYEMLRVTEYMIYNTLTYPFWALESEISGYKKFCLWKYFCFAVFFLVVCISLFCYLGGHDIAICQPATLPEIPGSPASFFFCVLKVRKPVGARRLYLCL